MVPGQTEQTPLIRKPLGRSEQRVQTFPELKAYPSLQTHLPLDRTWLVPQLEQTPLVAWVPEGQMVQTPLILPNPARQAQDWVAWL